MVESFIDWAKVFLSLAAIFVVLITVSTSPGVLALRTAKHILFNACRIVLETFLPLSCIES